MKGHVRKHGDGYQAIVFVGKNADGKPKYRHFPGQATNAGRIGLCGLARK